MVKVKRIDFPSFEEWKTNNSKFNKKINDFYIKSSYDGFGHTIGISVMNNPLNLYVPVVYRMCLPYKDSHHNPNNKRELDLKMVEDWYNKAVVTMNEKFEENILSYLED